ncbi:MAG: NADH-quinone oxidoreductase subunit I [Anaerolineales bacterium]|nr:NADH-quinone oxidoreductase subunit I [Anaerolineales bacterium]
MFGLGVVRGMGVTLKRFIGTFLRGYDTYPRAKEIGGLAEVERKYPTRPGGLFTVQYPEEKVPVPERFRNIPMLIYEPEPDSERAEYGGNRCTACGICAKVCPPQCIWIVQEKRANGRPVPVPKAFCIDASICMSCGFCAEYCPFDAIKMNQEFELSSYERHEAWLYDMDDLLVSTDYYAETHPTAWAEQEEVRRQKEEAKRKREEARRKREEAQKREAEKAQTEEAEDSSGGDEASDDMDEARRRKMEQRKKFLEARRKREEEAQAQEDNDS